MARWKPKQIPKHLLSDPELVGKVHGWIRKGKSFDSCWEWIGPIRAGRVAVPYYEKPKNGGKWVERRIQAARFVYAMNTLDFNQEMHLFNRCGNKMCVNPLHQSQQEYTYGGLPASLKRKPRPQKTHCKNGHEMTGENVKIVEGKNKATGETYPVRVCRACRKENSRDFKRKLRQRKNKGREGYCSEGHRMTPSNTETRKVKLDGKTKEYARCVICKREEDRRRYAARKQKESHGIPDARSEGQEGTGRSEESGRNGRKAPSGGGGAGQGGERVGGASGT